MKPELMGIEVSAYERIRLAPPMAARATAPVGASAEPLGADVPGAEERCSPAHGSTAEAGNPAEALALAQAALHSSRQAASVSLEIVAAAAELGVEPDEATKTADHIQAEAEALLALGQRLTRLAQALHEAAEGLRPSPERRRAALAESLQRFKQEHLALLQRAEAMLAGGGAISPHHLVSAEACGLGQWRQAAVEAGWGHATALQALERPHKAFHRALAGLLFAHQQGRADAANGLWAELEANAATVAASLEELCVSILQANDPASGVPVVEDEAALLTVGSGIEAHAPMFIP